MNTQPEAQRLADALSAAIKQVDADDDVIHVARWFVEDAAAELRRLSAENERLHQINQSHEMKLSVRGYEIQIADLEAQRDEARRTVREAHEAGTRLTAQRDALLEALKKAEENGCATVYANEDDECGERGCCGVMSYEPHADDCWVTMARAAIKVVEEGK